MVFFRLMTALALSFAVSTLSQAQTKVYESTDAEGNPVFTDTPSEGATSVEIPQTNVATPVEPGPPAAAVPEARAAPAGVVAAPEEQSGIIIVNRDEEEHREGDRWRTEHTEDGDILSQEPRHEQLEEVIDGETVPVERVLRSREPSRVHRGKR